MNFSPVKSAVNTDYKPAPAASPARPGNNIEHLPTSRPSPLALKLAPYINLSDGELTVIDSIRHQSCRKFAAGHEIMHERDDEHRAFLLHSGWVASYKTLADGSRQIIDFQIAGDFLGLHSMLLRSSDHSSIALTDIELTRISMPQVFDICNKHPRLAAAFLWVASRDESVVVEHLVDIARRRALVRTAHFLVELYMRTKLVGLGSPAGYRCPVTQAVLADALGLTAIHLNRVLRILREKNLLTFHDGFVSIQDLPRLIELAEFDDAYLDQATPILV